MHASEGESSNKKEAAFLLQAARGELLRRDNF